jgi:hypothetical protein
MIRVNVILPAALIVSMGVPAAAQEFAEYQNVRDGFKIDFPGQPTVTEGTYTSEHGFMLPQRIYSVRKGRETYSVTVADYRGIEAMGAVRAKACPPGSEPCLGSDLSGIGYWKHEIRGAVPTRCCDSCSATRSSRISSGPSSISSRASSCRR